MMKNLAISFNALFLVASSFAMALPASATGSHQDNVLLCISDIGEKTDWSECSTMMFSPCEANAVGSPSHVECLSAQQVLWDEHLQADIALLKNRLTDKGLTSLNENISQWYEFRRNRCNSVAAERAAIGFSREAAGYGCEISETAGIVSDLNNCLAGKSSAHYCALKE